MLLVWAVTSIIIIIIISISSSSSSSSSLTIYGQQVEQAQQNLTTTSTVKPNYLETGRQITEILNRFMNLGYDKRVRPNYGGPPVNVNVTMRILSISSVSEVMMDFTADFYFRQTWHDPRLSFKKLGDIQTLYVGAEVSKKIWIPDTFFGNEKMAYFHEATTPNVFLRIEYSGEVYRSIRLTVTSSCPMNLQYFPMDNQRCTIEAESYGYNVKDIIYHWARKDQAVERDKEISLPQFDIVKTVQKYRLEELSSGTYSRLIAEIHFARRMGYYLIQIYIPSSLIVVISWVSFWLHRNASPARVQLGVTTVLTMTTLMSSTNAALPKISYVKSIDIFLGTCFIMVFAALLEYATVGYLGKRIAMRKAHIQHAQSQAQARIFAQLQAQGAQGDPIEPIPSESTAAFLNSIPQSSVFSTNPQAADTSTHHQLHQLSTAQLMSDPHHTDLSLKQQQQQQQQFNAAQQHSLLNTNDSNININSSQPTSTTEPSPPPRHCRSTRCHFHSVDSTSDLLQQVDTRATCCSIPKQSISKPTTFNKQKNLTRSCQCLASCHHQASEKSANINLILPPAYLTTGSSLNLSGASSRNRKSPAVAAAAAAATFVNLHRRNKGLPPSTNPNFAHFQYADPVRNKNLETIFGIRPSDIDKYSRVVFPVCFICFQLMYWIVYLHISAFLETEQQQQQQ